MDGAAAEDQFAPEAQLDDATLYDLFATIRSELFACIDRSTFLKQLIAESKHAQTLEQVLQKLPIKFVHEWFSTRMLGNNPEGKKAITTCLKENGLGVPDVRSNPAFTGFSDRLIVADCIFKGGERYDKWYGNSPKRLAILALMVQTSNSDEAAFQCFNPAFSSWTDSAIQALKEQVYTIMRLYQACSKDNEVDVSKNIPDGIASKLLDYIQKSPLLKDIKGFGMPEVVAAFSNKTQLPKDTSMTYFAALNKGCELLLEKREQLRKTARFDVAQLAGLQQLFNNDCITSGAHSLLQQLIESIHLEQDAKAVVAYVCGMLKTIPEFVPFINPDALTTYMELLTYEGNMLSWKDDTGKIVPSPATNILAEVNEKLTAPQILVALMSFILVHADDLGKALVSQLANALAQILSNPMSLTESIPDYPEVPGYLITKFMARIADTDYALTFIEGLKPIFKNTANETNDCACCGKPCGFLQACISYGMRQEEVLFCTPCYRRGVLDVEKQLNHTNISTLPPYPGAGKDRLLSVPARDDEGKLVMRANMLCLMGCNDIYIPHHQRQQLNAQTHQKYFASFIADLLREAFPTESTPFAIHKLDIHLPAVNGCGEELSKEDSEKIQANRLPHDQLSDDLETVTSIGVIGRVTDRTLSTQWQAVLEREADFSDMLCAAWALIMSTNTATLKLQITGLMGTDNISLSNFLRRPRVVDKLCEWLQMEQVDVATAEKRRQSKDNSHFIDDAELSDAESEMSNSNSSSEEEETDSGDGYDDDGDSIEVNGDNYGSGRHGMALRGRDNDTLLVMMTDTIEPEAQAAKAKHPVQLHLPDEVRRLCIDFFQHPGDITNFVRAVLTTKNAPTEFLNLVIEFLLHAKPVYNSGLYEVDADKLALAVLAELQSMELPDTCKGCGSLLLGQLSCNERCSACSDKVCVDPNKQVECAALKNFPPLFLDLLIPTKPEPECVNELAQVLGEDLYGHQILVCSQGDEPAPATVVAFVSTKEIMFDCMEQLSPKREKYLKLMPTMYLFRSDESLFQKAVQSFAEGPLIGVADANDSNSRLVLWFAAMPETSLEALLEQSEVYTTFIATRFIPPPEEHSHSQDVNAVLINAHIDVSALCGAEPMSIRQLMAIEFGTLLSESEESDSEEFDSEESDSGESDLEQDDLVLILQKGGERAARCNAMINVVSEATEMEVEDLVDEAGTEERLTEMYNQL